MASKESLVLPLWVEEAAWTAVVSAAETRLGIVLEAEGLTGQELGARVVG